MSGRGRWALLVWLAAVLACVVIISRTQISTDLSAFLPRSPSPAQQVLVDQLRDGVVSRLVLIAVEGDSPEKLAPLSQALANRLRQENSFVSVSNGDEAALEKSRDFLWRNRYLLSSEVTPAHFSAPELRRALENDLQLLGSSAGILVKRVLPNDPTGELLRLLDQMMGDQPPLIRDGVWFSPDEKRILLVAQTRGAGFDFDAQQQALSLIRNHFEAAKEEAGATGARLLETGPGVFSVEIRQTIKGDALRLSLIAAILVASLLLLVYRSALLVVLGLLPVATGALAGVTAVSLGFGSVNGVTLGFGVTLIGEAVDYAVYLFTQTAPGSTPEATLSRIWPTLRLGVLTSICGFSAMLFSGFSGLAELGMLSIVGLIGAVSVTRFVLPVLLPANFHAVDARPFRRATVYLAQNAPRLRYPLAAIVLLAVVFLIRQPGGPWDDDIANLSPVPQNARLLDEQLRRDVGAPDVRFVAIATAPTQEQALAKSETVAAQLQNSVSHGTIAGFDFPAFYVPSRETQQARQTALPASDVLDANLEQAVAGLPFAKGLFDPFLRDVAAAKVQPLLDRTSVGDSDIALKLDSLLISRGGFWVAMLPLRGVTDVARLSNEIAESKERDVALLDLKEDFNRLYQGYRQEALVLALLGALAIVLLLSLFLRSVRRVYLVLTPLAAAVTMTTAVLAASGQKLSIFHLTGLLLVVAVGSNYSLFFESQSRPGEHRERTITSLALANLCTVIGFGILSFSRVPVLHGIGITVAIGTVLSLIFSAVLIEHAAPESQVRAAAQR